jgi:hypothetical protein
MKHRFRITTDGDYNKVFGEIKQWCIDNFGDSTQSVWMAYVFGPDLIVLFTCDEDAMAFKLQWS